MKEVAEEAGVSVSTVSRALRNDPLVSRETCELVRKAAEKVGYKPNPYVSTLMTQVRSSRPIPFKAVIALIDTLPTVTYWKDYAVQRKFHEGAEKQSKRLGYRLERFWASEPDMSRQRLSQMLASRGIRGVLIPPFKDYSLRGEDMPVEYDRFACVTLGCRAVSPGFHFASNDQYATSFFAHKKLKKLGYERIGLVLPGFLEEIVEQRFSAGFWAALEQKPQGSLPASILLYDLKTGAQEFADWVEKFKPDAVCSVVPEVRDWVTDLGFKVPDDLGLVTLDWEECQGDWSGINQDSALVGKASVDLLVQMLQRNELGVPERPYGIMTEGFWVDGQTSIQQ
ncbi:MAG: LacI family DNA-binding transcriptional regulator [Verrucomicrobiota bacterium]